MNRIEAQAVNNLLRWVLRLACPDDAPVSDDRFCGAALLLSRHARMPLREGLSPGRIAVPLRRLVESRQLALPPIAADVPHPAGLTAQWATRRGCHPCRGFRKVRDLADWLRALADAGYQLEGPIGKTAESTAHLIQRSQGPCSPSRSRPK
jgi:hypothetical protein